MGVTRVTRLFALAVATLGLVNAPVVSAAPAKLRPLVQADSFGLGPTTHAGSAAPSAHARPTTGNDVCLFGAPPCTRRNSLDGWEVPEAEASPACTPHFCVHWVPTTKNAPHPTDENGSDRPFETNAAPDDDTIPDFVELVGLTAERSYRIEVETMGWRPPVPDRGKGGDNRTDIYLFSFNHTPLGGLAIQDNHRPGPTKSRRSSAHLMLDDDYDDPAYAKAESVREVLRVLVPHEFAHIIQLAYDLHQDPWMYESTADWMASQVFPNPLYYGFTRPLANTTHQPLTEFGFRSYVLAIWPQWVDVHVGADAVRRAWELSDQYPRETKHSIATYRRAIRSVSEGRTSLSKEFGRFAIATAEWQGFGDLAKRYQDLERKKKLVPDGPVVTRKLDHLSWVMYDVPMQDHRDGQRYVMQASVEPGTKAAISLVGRRGGRIEQDVLRLPSGGPGVVSLPAGGEHFRRLTAVVVNADPRGPRYACDSPRCPDPRNNREVAARIALVP